jgi:putative proteasome-type protease
MQGASASMIVAGQRKGGAMRLFLIYPEGNFIEATEDTPFLQIGEHKYGKPILDRVVKPATSLADAQKAVLLSMDSTLRSNLSVGMPLDLAVIERDACKVTPPPDRGRRPPVPRHVRSLVQRAPRRVRQDQ